jgi:hypothetical protein
MKLLAIGTLAILFAAPAYATTGDEWLHICENGTTAQLCLGYIIGAMDAHTTQRFAYYLNLSRPDFISGQIDYCIPDGVTYEEIRRIAMKYIKEHPEPTYIQADVAIGRSLVQAFPCMSGR